VTLCIVLSFLWALLCSPKTHLALGNACAVSVVQFCMLRAIQMARATSCTSLPTHIRSHFAAKKRYLRRSHSSRLPALRQEGPPSSRQDPSLWSPTWALSPASFVATCLRASPSTAWLSYRPHVLFTPRQRFTGPCGLSDTALRRTTPLISCWLWPKNLEPGSGKHFLCLSTPAVMEAAGPHWRSIAVHGASIVLLTSTHSPKA
jgi:hypothetical protein